MVLVFLVILFDGSVLDSELYGYVYIICSLFVCIVLDICIDVSSFSIYFFFFFFSCIRCHTRCALVTGFQTFALPIYSSLIMNFVTFGPYGINSSAEMNYLFSGSLNDSGPKYQYWREILSELPSIADWKIQNFFNYGDFIPDLPAFDGDFPFPFSGTEHFGNNFMLSNANGDRKSTHLNSSH